ncbi:uncharacterized protein EV422DRAFT_547906 [Fimicolochytrium jonesii]|uniref:uncharacterized protein n=1 Tax=Fimicolochytrium jonesii TaxID=1396493 RepID=UPI0022FE8BCF|nr:uncharacterized protein EV422DRAFT_547906 [Fimicolochytrium jonesii]KAI8815871.1 hypothetical protein EV422DRAFT_547906 [Fimicolochytrium jonesii]
MIAMSTHHLHPTFNSRLRSSHPPPHHHHPQADSTYSQTAGTRKLARQPVMPIPEYPTGKNRFANDPLYPVWWGHREHVPGKSKPATHALHYWSCPKRMIDETTQTLSNACIRPPAPPAPRRHSSSPEHGRESTPRGFYTIPFRDGGGEEVDRSRDGEGRREAWTDMAREESGNGGEGNHADGKSPQAASTQTGVEDPASAAYSQKDVGESSSGKGSNQESEKTSNHSRDASSHRSRHAPSNNSDRPTSNASSHKQSNPPSPPRSTYRPITKESSTSPLRSVPLEVATSSAVRDTDTSTPSRRDTSHRAPTTAAAPVQPQPQPQPQRKAPGAFWVDIKNLKRSVDISTSGGDVQSGKRGLGMSGGASRSAHASNNSARMSHLPVPTPHLTTSHTSTTPSSHPADNRPRISTILDTFLSSDVVRMFDLTLLPEHLRAVVGLDVE